MWVNETTVRIWPVVMPRSNRNPHAGLDEGGPKADGKRKSK
jgi:hypothetical protein